MIRFLDIDPKPLFCVTGTLCS